MRQAPAGDAETRSIQLSLDRTPGDWAGGVSNLRRRPPKRGEGRGTRSVIPEAKRSPTEAIMTDQLIDRNPDILGGTPVFSGTRVPVRILMEHLEAGDRLDEFLDDYPTVTREQAVELLERATT